MKLADNNIPKLRFPEIVGEWELTKIKDAFSIFNGYAFSSNDSQANGARWVKIADVGIQEMKISSPSYLPLNFLNKHKKFILKKGDFVIALTRPILGDFLKISKIDDRFDNSLLNQRVGKLVSDNVHLFIYNLLQRKILIKSIANNIAGSDPPNLSPSEINNIKIHLPSISEQQKIAQFLSSVDTKIEQLTKKKNLLVQYKKGVMQQIFSQQLRFKDEKGNDFPDWEEKRLGDISNITIGEFVIKTKQNPNGKYPVFNGGKTCTGYYGSYNNEGNKIIISARGANAGFVNYEKGKFWAGNSCYSVDIIDKDTNSVHFIFHYVKFKQNLFTDYQQAANIPSVSKKDAQIFKIICPKKEEQTQIANFLIAIDKKIELVNTQLENTQQFKKGLLQQMFV